jgi:uncharacterized membrane protein (UPF0127 family)
MNALLALALIVAAPPPSCSLPDGTRITLELAISDEERAQGLMFRDQLPPDHGMLFLFDREGHYPFWMKNTFIALDIVWLSRTGEVVDLQANAVPCRFDPCPSYVPSQRARAVLELAGGSAERHGLRPGARVVCTGVPGFPLAAEKP